MSKISIVIEFEEEMTQEHKEMIQDYFREQLKLNEKLADQFRPFEEHFGRIIKSDIVVD